VAGKRLASLLTTAVLLIGLGQVDAHADDLPAHGPITIDAPTDVPTIPELSYPVADASRAYPVPASIPSDCSVDVAADLNAFVGSVPNGAPGVAGPIYSTIVFEPGTCYRVESKLTVWRRAFLRFEGNGSRIETRDVDNGGHQPAWEAYFSHHVYLRGFVIDGDYSRPSYYSGPPFEWSHGFIFGGSHDVGVSDSEVHNVRGDGVTVAPKWDGRTPVQPYNVRVTNVDVDGCGRMGNAFTGGHDVVFEDSDLRNCPWIFDLELEWAPIFGIEDVTIRGNTTGLYRLVWLANGGQCGTHDNILVEGNVMLRNGPTSWAPVTVKPPTGCGVPRTGYVIRGNTFRIPGWGSADWGTHLQGTVGAVIDANTYIYDERSDANNYLLRTLNSVDTLITGNVMQGGWHLVKNLGGSTWFVEGNSCSPNPCQEQ